MLVSLAGSRISYKSWDTLLLFHLAMFGFFWSIFYSNLTSVSSMIWRPIWTEQSSLPAIILFGFSLLRLANNDYFHLLILLTKPTHLLMAPAPVNSFSMPLSPLSSYHKPPSDVCFYPKCDSDRRMVCGVACCSVRTRRIPWGLHSLLVALCSHFLPWFWLFLQLLVGFYHHRHWFH